MTDDNERLLWLGEVAKIIGVSLATARHRWDQGMVHGPRSDGGAPPGRRMTTLDSMRDYLDRYGTPEQEARFAETIDPTPKMVKLRITWDEMYPTFSVARGGGPSGLGCYVVEVTADEAKRILRQYTRAEGVHAASQVELMRLAKWNEK